MLQRPAREHVAHFARLGICKHGVIEKAAAVSKIVEPQKHALRRAVVEVVGVNFGFEAWVAVAYIDAAEVVAPLELHVLSLAGELNIGRERAWLELLYLAAGKLEYAPMRAAVHGHGVETLPERPVIECIVPVRKLIALEGVVRALDGGALRKRFGRQ